MRTSAMHPRARTRLAHRRLTALIAIVTILWPYMFSIASSDTTFTLVNRTRYYLHAIVNSESFVYIAPGRSVNVKVQAPVSIYARVRYSPGQGVKGTGERTVEITATVTSTPAVTTCSSNGQGGNTCESTNDPTTTTSVTPEKWDVLPSDLASE